MIWKIYNQKVNRTLDYLGFNGVYSFKDSRYRYYDTNKIEVFSSPLLFIGTSDSEHIMLRRFKDIDFYEYYDLDGNFIRIEKI